MLTIVRERPMSRLAHTVRTYERTLRRIILISPWMGSPARNAFPPLAQVIVCAQSAKALLTVLTRRPDKVNHAAAVAALATITTSEVLFLNSLHAKLYLVECEGLRVALFGSPNLTPEGDSLYRELAVDVRSTRESDASGEFVADLFAFARDLMTDPSATFYKRRGMVPSHSEARCKP
jgi:hypothetical protein